VEFLIKLFNLLHSFLVVSISLRNLHELRSQVGENVREISNTENNDDHGPEQFIVVGWKDVTISNCCTGDSGPI